MSLHRPTLLVLAVLFSAGMTSVASAGCCGWEVQAPVAYAAVAYGGCGGCGTPTAATVYAEPVAPAPPPAPVAVSPWAWGTGCGCHHAAVYAAVAAEPTLIAPAPIYVVNQGPDYTGPGIMVPYRTWPPAASYITRGAYPYVPGYGYGYGYGYRRYGYHYGVHRPFVAPRARFAYRAHFYGHPFYRRPLPLGRPAFHHYYR